MDICVVDTGSNLVVFSFIDGVWMALTDISTKKAKTVYGLQGI